MKIEISKIKDGVIWMQCVHDGEIMCRAPLAQTLRDYIAPEYEMDKASGDSAKGFGPEQAFKKLKISRAFESELQRA